MDFKQSVSLRLSHVPQNILAANNGTPPVPPQGDGLNCDPEGELSPGLTRARDLPYKQALCRRDRQDEVVLVWGPPKRRRGHPETQGRGRGRGRGRQRREGCSRTPRARGREQEPRTLPRGSVRVCEMREVLLREEASLSSSPTRSLGLVTAAPGQAHGGDWVNN